MHQTSVIYIVFWLTACLHPLVASKAPPFQEKSIAELEQELTGIDSELEQLATCTLRAGVGAVGYGSNQFSTPKHKQWIHINLEDTYSIDQIVLVPMLWRDPHFGVQSDGFPSAFRILAGDQDNPNTIASVTQDDSMLPRIAPLVITLPEPISTSWIKLEVTKMTPGGLSRKYVLQLSEILIFSSNENVALRKVVSVKGPKKKIGHEQPGFLVDGFLPYLMDAHIGKESEPPMMPIQNISNAFFTIDLEESFPINQINLHTIDLNHRIPLRELDGYGVPERLRVTGANQADFSDAITLFDYERRSYIDSGPIISRRFPEISCRFVRLTALGRPRKSSPTGFSEIEVLSAGQNIAIGKQLSCKGFSSAKNLAKMTDGHNFYGTILPMREWMNQLARRHDLEVKRPLLVAELNQRYTDKKSQAKRLYWLSTLLIISVIAVIAVERMLHRHRLKAMKTRLAADLHDELGANMHSIGLLSDFAEQAIDSPEKLRPYLQRIRTMSERTGSGIRQWTDMLEKKHHNTDVVGGMQRIAKRVVTEIEHNFNVEGECYLTQLPQIVQKDLLLFYKESLININRHADASQIATHLSADKQGIQLTVSDNGQGLPQKTKAPASLKRRAKLLKAKLTVKSSATTGTHVTLSFRPRRWRIQ